jgi:hypothetical protein
MRRKETTRRLEVFSNEAVIRETRGDGKRDLG